jgi:L-fuculose-phosphate aldolase
VAAELYEVRQKLAAACRILAAEGHESGLAGQVTARAFHVWIYRKRPDVGAIVHTHAPYASALSCTSSPLKTLHMDSAMLHGSAHLAEWPGVPVADDEGRIISGALGDAKTILLANHGSLTTGTHVEEAVYLAVFFERAARMQLRALAAGGYREVKPELAEEARDFLRQPSIVTATFAYWARRYA